MPNRIIKEACRSSKRLDALSDGSERLFWRLITVADDFGRFEADPILIKSACFPRKVDGLKTKNIKKWIDELSHNQLILIYKAENEELYGQFNKWEDHQGRKRARHSKHPSPFDNKSKKVSNLNENDGQLTASDSKIPREARSEKREARNENAKKNCFDLFYKSYPKKKGKDEALKAWLKLKPSEDLIKKIMNSLEAQKQQPDWSKESGQYIPHPATWLNRKRWEDEIKVSVSSVNKFVPKRNTTLLEFDQRQKQRESHEKNNNGLTADIGDSAKSSVN